MSTSKYPALDAEEARQAMRALAHATRSLSDPREIYPTLGSLSLAAASMSQSLHQLAAFHDPPERPTGWRPEDSPGARAAVCRVAWELHRAGDILRAVGEAIDHAHEAEATLVYHDQMPTLMTPPTPSAPPPAATRDAEHGLGL